MSGLAVPPSRQVASSAHPAAPDGTGERDGGMVTAFVVVFALALVFVAGLVYDGGRMLASHRQAENLADSAARAGAQAISDPAWRATGQIVLDEEAARAQACSLLARAGHPCGGGTQVSVTGDTVSVTVRFSIDLALLPGASQQVEGHGSACVVTGITGTEATATC